MKISIHQPNLFPYEGVLDKAKNSDLLVLLNHVQFSPGGYQNRFRFDSKWYTMSVNKGLEPLLRKRYISAKNDWEKIKSKLKQNLDKVSQQTLNIESFDNCIESSFVETNTKIIKRIFDRLKITTPIKFDFPTELNSTERLIQICKTYGADCYLSGPSGPKYMDIALFERCGIKVEIQTKTTGRTAIELLLESERT